VGEGHLVLLASVVELRLAAAEAHRLALARNAAGAAPEKKRENDERKNGPEHRIPPRGPFDLSRHLDAALDELLHEGRLVDVRNSLGDESGPLFSRFLARLRPDLVGAELDLLQ